MRTSSIFALLLLLTFPLLGQQTDDLIVPRTAAAQILIPAAGDVVGANGTHFRSDISIINLRNAAQRVLLLWLPQGSSGTTSGQVITINALSGVASENFVSEFLQRTGLGSIEIVGVNADDSFDPNAQLHVTSRIWTPRPEGTSGTMSQTFPAIVMQTENTNVKSIFGVRHSAQYRLNVGISNPRDAQRQFRVTIIIAGDIVTSFSFDIPVDPRSMQQVNVPATTTGVVQVLIQETTIGGTPGTWHAWASSIDNESGDAWSQMAVSGQ